MVERFANIHSIAKLSPEVKWEKQEDKGNKLIQFKKSMCASHISDARNILLIKT